MATTLKDIAQRAGVSVQSVSRILRNQGQAHAPETCQRVLRVAQELDYQPSLISRALLGARSMSIGVIVRGLGGRVTTARVRRMVGTAQEKGYLSFIADLEQPGDDSEQVVAVVKDLVSRRVDGLVVYRSMPLSVPARRFLADQSVPVVFMGWGPPQSSRRIEVDREAGMRQVAQHLADLGHRSVAFIPSRGALDFPGHKVLPYQRAFAERGIDLAMDPRWAVDGEMGVERSAYEVVGALLRSPAAASLTALVFNNDEAASAGLAAARDAGRRVPEDLSIVGHDDLPIAPFLIPSLTTVVEPGAEVGQAAFDMLEQLIADPKAPVRRRRFPTRLVVRRSTGPAPPPPPP